MVCKLRRSESGFSLIELLIVVAIIGIIASMLIPNLLDAMQKAKQKRTVAEIRITGSSLFSWLTDQVGAAAAGQSTTQVDVTAYGAGITADNLASILVPQYVQRVPSVDGWKNTYDYYLQTADLHARRVMAIRSRGRDGAADSTSYTVTSFDPTDYDRDIVWADGFMVRYPGK
jgi:general secretion pathway protein G